MDSSALYVFSKATRQAIYLSQTAKTARIARLAEYAAYANARAAARAAFLYLAATQPTYSPSQSL